MPLVSDLDREAATVALRNHYASGRLSLSELTERLQVALAARRGSDLAARSASCPRRGAIGPSSTAAEERGWFAARSSSRRSRQVGRWSTCFSSSSFVAVSALHGLSLLETLLLPLAWIVTTLVAFRIARR